MKVKKGDQVLIIAGKDKGKQGKIIASFPQREKITVEGINLRKKHMRPRKSGEKGQIVNLPGPISVSNVKILCSKCGKAARVGYKLLENKKYRICKKCSQEI